ncbi:hypothetical protein ISCGN_028779, partial [Ixodes scapularis]
SPSSPPPRRRGTQSLSLPGRHPGLAGEGGTVKRDRGFANGASALLWEALGHPAYFGQGRAEEGRRRSTAGPPLCHEKRGKEKRRPAERTVRRCEFGEGKASSSSSTSRAGRTGRSPRPLLGPTAARRLGGAAGRAASGRPATCLPHTPATGETT